MRKWLIFGILTLTFSHSQAQYDYQFNQQCKQAYEKLLFLQLDSAKIILEKEGVENPNNLIPILLYNYHDFLSLILTEDKNLFDEIESVKKERLQRWEQGPEVSPWYLSGQAQIKLQWAFSRVLFDEYFSAALEINSAYHLLEENKEKHPDFLADNMGIGILHAMIGVVPEQYQWAMEMLGLYGSIEQGMSEMKKQLNHDSQHPFSKETLFYYTFLRLNLTTDSSRFTELLNYYEKSSFSRYTKESPLLHFSKAALLLKINNDTAIKYLQQTPYRKDAYYFYYSDFLLGQSLLYKLDGASSQYYEKYIQDYPGKNYKKAALQKLAWAAFITGDVAGYKKAMRRIPNIGAEILDADKVALKESKRVEEGWLPNLYLLRSRLQFDGHYYKGAMLELEKLTIEGISNSEVILESYYRKARIFHEMNRLEEAKVQYSLALNNGRQSERYFAANAALKLGEIAENSQAFSEAAEYYQIVLDLDFNEYRKGIRAKAKAGLQRVEK